MADPPSRPLPQPTFPLVGSSPPTQPYAEYFAQLDATVRAVASLLLGTPTQLTNAANDVAAAAAGVKIGQAYRNGSVLMIRVK